MNEAFCRHLQETDRYYGRGKVTRNFYNIFTGCPFFQLFRIVREDVHMSSNMGVYIKNIIAGIMGSQQYEESADDYGRSGRLW